MFVAIQVCEKGKFGKKDVCDLGASGQLKQSGQTERFVEPYNHEFVDCIGETAQ